EVPQSIGRTSPPLRQQKSFASLRPVESLADAEAEGTVLDRALPAGVAELDIERLVLPVLDLPERLNSRGQVRPVRPRLLKLIVNLVGAAEGQMMIELVAQENVSQPHAELQLRREEPEVFRVGVARRLTRRRESLIRERGPDTGLDAERPGVLAFISVEPR